MASPYLIWTRDIVAGACSLDGMTGYEDDWKLMHAEPVGDAFPAKARFAMNPDAPHDVALTDNLYNGDTLIVASQRLKDLIAAQGQPSMEFLKVPIFNHKKRAIDEPYYIVHPVGTVDCLQIEACQPKWSRIDKDTIDRVKQLVIDEARIPVDKLLFRPKHFVSVVLVHRSLAEQVDAAGMTGVRWVELDNYPER